MARRKVSAAEVRLAKQFLRAVGANAASPLLVLAIAAWVHTNFKRLSNVRGNNPFLVRAGIPGASRYGLGTFKFRGVYYVKYRSIAEAVKGAAFVFKQAHKYTLEPYLAAGLRALKRNDRNSALDFLVSLALSGWSSSHFGLSSDQLKQQPGQHYAAVETKQNPLIAAYVGSTWVQRPPAVKQPPKPPPAPPKPRALLNDIPRRDYIEPYHAFHWYEQRVKDATGSYEEP